MTGLEMIEKALSCCPGLTSTGVDTGRKGVRGCTPLNAEQVELCAAWLATQPTVRPRSSKYYDSYHLKHVVEDWLSERDTPHYIANGAMIAAAIAMGYKTTPPMFGCPNLDVLLGRKLENCREQQEMRRLRAEAPWRRG